MTTIADAYEDQIMELEDRINVLEDKLQKLGKALRTILDHDGGMLPFPVSRALTRICDELEGKVKDERQSLSRL